MELYLSNTTVSSPSTTTTTTTAAATTTTTFLMGAAASSARTIRANATSCAFNVAAATTTTSCGNAANNDGAGYSYHEHSQSQAIIYIVVILVLYFSALTVLIVRYVTKERNQLRSNRSTLKKNRGERFFACPREIEISNMSTLSTQFMSGDRDGSQSTVAPPPVVPHLSVSSPSMSLLIPPSIHHHMDTAV